MVRLALRPCKLQQETTPNSLLADTWFIYTVHYHCEFNCDIDRPYCDWNVTYTGAIKNHFALDINWKDTYFPIALFRDPRRRLISGWNDNKHAYGIGSYCNPVCNKEMVVKLCKCHANVTVATARTNLIILAVSTISNVCVRARVCTIWFVTMHSAARSGTCSFNNHTSLIMIRGTDNMMMPML